jgi:hypothetical protein
MSEAKITGKVDLSGLGQNSPSRPGERALGKLLSEVYREIAERLDVELKDVFIGIEDDRIKVILFLDSDLDPVEIEATLAGLVEDFIDDRSTIDGVIPDEAAPSLRTLAAHFRDLAQRLEQAMSRGKSVGLKK